MEEIVSRSQPLTPSPAGVRDWLRETRRYRNGGLSYACPLGNGRGTVSGKGGQLMAETDGPGGTTLHGGRNTGIS